MSDDLVKLLRDPGEILLRTERFDDELCGPSMRLFIDHADPVIWISGELLRDEIIAPGNNSQRKALVACLEVTREVSCP